MFTSYMVQEVSGTERRPHLLSGCISWVVLPKRRA